MSQRLMTFFLVFVAFSPVQAQETGEESRFEEAKASWDTGHFVEALVELESLLLRNPGETLRDRIALLTGELFPVEELAKDGRAVRWSPDGAFVAFESVEGSDVVTHLLPFSGDGVGGETAVPGSGFVFSPSGNLGAFLTVPESPALREARARLEEEFGGTDRASRMRLRAQMTELNARHTVLKVLDMATLEETEVQPQGLAISALFFGPDDGLFLLGREEGGVDATLVFRVGQDGSTSKIAEGPGSMSDPFFAGAGSFLVYGAGRGSFGVLSLATGEDEVFSGSTPIPSRDGGRLVYLAADGSEPSLRVLTLSTGGVGEEFAVSLPFPPSTGATRACPACPLQSGLALDPEGEFAVVQARPREDWELLLVPLSDPDGTVQIRQITREIQHDLYPTFLADGRLLAMKGEGRHRRSHLYDLQTGESIWLFRNNTVRTVAPEYEWAPSPDGTRLLLVAERDGNTVSPERGVYLMDLSRKVTNADLLARVRGNLKAERELRAKAEVMYGPLAQEIGAVVDAVSMSRIFGYEEALFQFGSKNVSQPGNGPAIDYIADRLRGFGFEPELQWFDARGAQSANVVARIVGTESPDVVYAVSAHFDSNARSPGADDNTSATVGLLEMARVLADHPLPATVEIALFTGEESGLLGSREYVRRAVESGKNLVGALNNDMVGFAEDHRLDNTIRYSNAGIRDLQHGAAILFSEMVSHDAEYFKSTDAAAYYDAFGDIVGGIGSYPILASPHYHQSHDVLETINHKLVTEVAKMSTASIMLMASSPSRLGGLEATRTGGEVVVTWDPAVEAGIKAYRVAFGPEGDSLRTVVEVSDPRVALENLPSGTLISVKAVNERGLEGWDWARIRLGGQLFP